jgi:hypothetical protein
MCIITHCFRTSRRGISGYGALYSLHTMLYACMANQPKQNNDITIDDVIRAPDFSFKTRG